MRLWVSGGCGIERRGSWGNDKVYGRQSRSPARARRLRAGAV